jgi:phosphatidylethanolamine-binding protein (PEBP) family uncharacterized protein
MKESPSITQTLSAAGAGATLRIHFPETTISEAAANVTIAASAPTPTLSVLASALKSTTPGVKYLAVSIDLDAPFPSFPVLGPILHGAQADLVPGAVDADGFVALEGGSAEWQVAPYVGPGPPPLSAPHRYVFMVFEQPEGMDTAKVKSVLGLQGPGTGVVSRMRWDQEAAEKSLGLGEVVAGNYFLTRR